MQLTNLIEMSNRYGGNADYVLAGGGNTSYKDGQTMVVKASGAALSDITAEGFVKMNRAALNRMFERDYPADPQAREAEVLRDMLAACCETGNSEASVPRRRRPSVEALLHHIMPCAYVLHVHPAAVNGMTCGKNGAQVCAKLFPGAVWMEQMMPGYVLAKEARARISSSTRLLFLENHGVFIGGENTEEIDNIVMQMNAVLDAAMTRRPDVSPCEYNRALAEGFSFAVREIAAGGGACVFRSNREVVNITASGAIFACISPAFTPDHMVYCNDEALFIESGEIKSARTELAEKTADYRARNGKPPKIIGLKDTGFYACGGSEKEAGIAAAVFLDAVKVYVCGESFGGARPMCEALVREINQWEVEHYRKSVSFKQ